MANNIIKADLSSVEIHGTHPWDTVVCLRVVVLLVFYRAAFKSV